MMGSVPDRPITEGGSSIKRLKNESRPTESLASDRVVHLSGMRKPNSPYVFIWVLYYAWVVAFSTWWTASPLTEDVFGSELRSLMHVANLVSSAVFVFLLRKEWYVRTARIGAVLIVGGMATFLSVPNALVQLIAAVVIAASLGCVNISILMPFVFTLNNTEKLYAVVGSNALINAIGLILADKGASPTASSRELLFSLALIAVALLATLFFKKSSVTENLKPASIPAPKLHAWVYLTLVLNCVFAILCKGAGRGVLNIAVLEYGAPVLKWYSVGGLLGCALYITVYAFSKKSIYIAWNITFGSMIMGLLLNAFSGMSPRLVSLFAVLVGISSTMGMINMYYILGVIGKKYNSLRYIRFSILFIGLCGGVGGVLLGNIITDKNSFDISFAVSVFTSAIFLLFLIFSPSLAPVYYEDEWAKDSEKTEVGNERLSTFKRYKLTTRETEVCQLLLRGYTMRQISGILSLKYPTVNTYCTAAYRKLGINSRTELLVMFRDYAAKELPTGK